MLFAATLLQQHAQGTVVQPNRSAADSSAMMLAVKRLRWKLICTPRRQGQGKSHQRPRLSVEGNLAAPWQCRRLLPKWVTVMPQVRDCLPIMLTRLYVQYVFTHNAWPFHCTCKAQLYLQHNQNPQVFPHICIPNTDHWPQGYLQSFVGFCHHLSSSMWVRECVRPLHKPVISNPCC